jgi:hypothetical protein
MALSYGNISRKTIEMPILKKSPSIGVRPWVTNTVTNGKSRLKEYSSRHHEIFRYICFRTPIA